MLGTINIVFLAISVVVLQVAVAVNSEDSSIVLLHVVFRHGARAPTEFCSSDPNADIRLYTTGLGELTSKGKKQSYQLGKFFASHYLIYTGGIFTGDTVYIRSTDYSRTKMSAELVLAGMMSSSKSRKVGNSSNQPICVEFKKLEDEDVLHRDVKCPYYDEVSRVLPNDQYVHSMFINPYIDIYNYIEKNCNKPMTDPFDLASLVFTLRAESNLNYSLPKWANVIFPDPLNSAAALYYAYRNYDKRLREINTGYILKKIIDDTKRMMNKTSGTKMFMYSGHEKTIGYLMDVLHINVTSIPLYSTALIFEIHQKKDNYYVKLRYKNETNSENLVNLSIRGCSILCPWEEFANLTKNLLPKVSVEEACLEVHQNNKP